MKTNHPDVSSNTKAIDRTRAIGEAYEVLKRAKSRCATVFISEGIS